MKKERNESNIKEIMKITISQGRSERMENIYLGTILTVEWTSNKEIRQQIGMAKQDFNRKKQYFVINWTWNSGRNW